MEIIPGVGSERLVVRREKLKIITNYARVEHVLPQLAKC